MTYTIIKNYYYKLTQIKNKMDKITFSVTKMAESNLPIREFILLNLLATFDVDTVKELYLRQFNSEESFNGTINLLIKTGYILLINDKVELREKALELLEKEEQVKEDKITELAYWIREQFPKDKKGDKQGIVKKLKQFMKTYKEFKNEDIIKSATQRYLSTTNPKYVKYAHYFIIKDNISTLATYCDMIISEKTDGGSKMKTVL